VKINIATIVLVCASLAMSSCGVRGNPQPPLTSPELGHGQPGFKRASDEFAFPNVSSPTPAPATTPSQRQDNP
jgi:hypothetical protein